ncbi:MAG: CCA tRNA nucleotidyltransferase [Acidobacteriaceae bacterium]
MQKLSSNPLLKGIIELLPKDESIYLVGGAIRDALLDRPGYDLDFVTGGEAMEIARMVANEIGAAYFPLDKQRKIARLVFNPKKDAKKLVNTWRRIDFSKFQGKDLQNDLQSRDFTINAMAVEVHHLQTLLDPLGGAEDLISRRLRTCSGRSFLDDPVRILRAVRFSVDLELKILPDSKLLLKQAVRHLPEVSAERLRDELFRILAQKHPSTSLHLLDRLGALEHILPEVSLLKGVQQGAPHVLDAWGHTLAVVSRMEDLFEVLAAEFDSEKASNLVMGMAALQLGRFRMQLKEHLEVCLNPERPHRAILYLAGLYHDAGKPKARATDEAGKISFIDHEQIGSRMVEKRGQALRLSNLEIDRLKTIVSHHMRPARLSHSAAKPGRKQIYRFFRDTGAAGIDICLISLADLLATYGAALPQDRWVKQLEVVRELFQVWWEDQEAGIFPSPLINGDELMKELNIAAGPEVGYLLEAIREAQVAGEIHTREEAINQGKIFLRDYQK